MTAEHGQMLSHYRLVEKIGEGGMGVVWKAEDTVLNRAVAIKVLPADLALDEERRRMFLDEARLAASVSHAHIVQVHELGRENDLDFIVMEYVEGQSLNAFLRGRPLPADKVAEWGLQVAEGLARAHRKGLIHRDLKPANILVTPDNEVKIVDFGLAVLFERRDSTVSLASNLTESLSEETRTRIAGTLPYMSPEQVRGERLDTRSDIFSFGTVLYEMTTGQRPFQGAKAADLVQEILKSQPTPVHELVPKVPLDLHRVIEKALARARADRYQHMDDVAVDLRRLHKDLESRSSPSYEDLQQRIPPRRSRRLQLALAAVGVIAIAAIGSRLGRDDIKDQTPVSATTGTPNWILVAEFDGPSDRPDLAIGVRELVIAALEQSAIVVPIPQAELARGLELAMKPDTTRVIGDVARELAYRATARTYVEGRVDRIMSGYSIVFRVLDAEQGQLVASVSGTAANDEILISTIDRLSRSLREKLGEKADAVRHGEHPTWRFATRNASLAEIITPSFEAFTKFVQCKNLNNEKGYNEAGKRLLRQALELDSDFALAWIDLYYAYMNEGLEDSARVAYAEVMHHSDRLTDTQRLVFEANAQAYLFCDPEAALQTYEIVRLGDPAAAAQRGVILGFLGRTEEAIDIFTQAIEQSPFAPPPMLMGWLMHSLLILGRHEAAAEWIPKLPEYTRRRPELRLALVAEMWTEAESLATVLRHDSRVEETHKFTAGIVLAGLEARSGQLAVAASTLDSLVVVAPSPSEAIFAHFTRQFLLRLAEQEPFHESAPSWSDTTADGLVYGALQGVAYSDTAAIARYLRQMRASSDCELGWMSQDEKYFEAAIAAFAGRWHEVVHVLESVKTTNFTSGTLPVRWLLSQAHEALGDRNAAVKDCESMLDAAGTNSHDQLFLRHFVLPFLHRRLVLLDSGMGRIDDARRHWESFQATVTNPDEMLRPLILEAQQALLAVEAKR